MPHLFGSPHPAQAVPPRRKTSLLFPESEIPGRYDNGFSTLILSAFHRFEYSRSLATDEVIEDQPEQYDRYWGRWSLDGDRLLLKSERREYGTYGDRRPPSGRGYLSYLYANLYTRFIPAKWENRICLVDEHLMPTFCQAMSFQIGFPLYWMTLRCPVAEYLKLRGDKPDAKEFEKPFPSPLNPGHPLIPARYWSFYEQGPIHAKVVKMLPKAKQGDIPSNCVRVLLSEGVAGRMKTGQILVGMGEDYATVIVYAVRERESEAVRLDLSDFPLNPIRVGDMFSSGELVSDWGDKRGIYFPVDTRHDLPSWAATLRDIWHG